MSADLQPAFHSLCWMCWTDRHGGDIIPVRVIDPPMTRCCDCGDGHTSGIYTRDIVDADEFPECECDTDDE